MPRVTASGRVRSAMKDIVAGLGDWLSSSSSCPRPPRNMPLAAAVVRKARRCTFSGATCSITSTGVDEMLLGQDSTFTPSPCALAP